MNAHVRFPKPSDDHGPVPDLPSLLAAPVESGGPICLVCGGVIKIRKDALVCFARYRAFDSRCRRHEVEFVRFMAVEAALMAALTVVGELRGDLARRGAP